MQHLQVLEDLEKQDALSAGPDFLGAVGILHAMPPHERLCFWQLATFFFKDFINRMRQVWIWGGLADEMS
jgi:hypothetical protein